jgi:hypothetical protein
MATGHFAGKPAKDGLRQGALSHGTYSCRSYIRRPCVDPAPTPEVSRAEAVALARRGQWGTALGVRVRRSDTLLHPYPLAERLRS